MTQDERDKSLKAFVQEIMAKKNSLNEPLELLEARRTRKCYDLSLVIEKECGR